MPIQIDTVTDIPESKFLEVIQGYHDFDNADIVTAYRDSKGTFTVESTIFDRTAGAAAGTITIKGKMSVFGGPNDHVVKPDEGLALYDQADVAANPGLFLPNQPPGTTGLARRLNPNAMYLACRWEYGVTPKAFLKAAKVKVSKEGGQPTEARPVDWGPNSDTGRTADLSPGLAAALGLQTDQVCIVEFDSPAGAQLPPAGAGVATGVNLQMIDATLFPADMTRRLVVMTTTDNATYWIVNQVGPNEGGQSLVKRVGNTNKIVLSDSTVFPVEASAEIPKLVADELNKAAPETGTVAGGPPGSPPATDAEVNAKMFAKAQAFVGHITSNVPGTDGGNLACAWAVNEVTRLALGKPISSVGGQNGLSTDGIFDALKAHHTKLASAAAAQPGTIIIAPTEGANHGHVGIVGAAAGGKVLVYSNKSKPGVFAQNFTVASFTNHYTGRGLDVLFYALKRDQFV